MWSRALTFPHNRIYPSIWSSSGQSSVSAGNGLRRSLTPRRWLTTKKRDGKFYKDIYVNYKSKFLSKKLPKDVNLHSVFACNELNLDEVEVYGFDYDYTLAEYKASLDVLIYNLSRDRLIDHFKYPQAIKDLPYNNNFAIRGLHYDIEKGLLLKLDSFLQIQLGTVYRGCRQLADSEVLHIYKNRSMSRGYVEGYTDVIHEMDGKKERHPTKKMVQLADLFSVPEMTLLCNVADYFEKLQIDYHPEMLFRDVKNSVGMSHPVMHNTLCSGDISEYIEPNPDIEKFFKRLVAAKKKLFLVTNSPLRFVDRGMTLLLGNDWREYFDVIIVQARKPKFFTESTRPLRAYDEKTMAHSWDRVTKIEKGKIYQEGSAWQLQKLTGWHRGERVLYFGDHPYSDLADVTLEYGWRTGAIIAELQHEIETLNREDFKQAANWLQMLTQLIEVYHCDAHQLQVSHCGRAELRRWFEERDDLRRQLKEIFNPHFGSVFRTYNNPTYFSRRLFRFADIYTAKLTNLLNYSERHTFYPRRGVMPHEYTNYFL